MYVEMLERAGARPLLVPPSESGVEETLDALDGLLLSGGADLDPGCYAAEPAPGDERDASARATVRSSRSSQAALARDLPVLAVCRGSQILNVARGGDLVQHLPERRRPRGAPGGARRVLGPPVRIEDGSAARRARRRPRAREVAPPPGLRPGRRRACARSRGRTTAPSRRSRTRRGGSLSACSGIRRPARTCACSRRSSTRRARTGRSGVDEQGPEPGHRGGHRRARVGRCGGDRRGRRAGEGGVPGVARGRADRPGPAAAPARDARRGASRGAGADRVAERRQADRGRARRGRDGGPGLPLLRGRGRQARRRDDPGGGRRRHDVPRAARRRRADHAVELPAQHRLLEARAVARVRQHGRAEASRADAAVGAAARRSLPSRRGSRRAS